MHNNLVKGLTLALTFVFLVAGGLWLWYYLENSPPVEPPVQPTVSKQDQPVPEKKQEMPDVLPEKARDQAKPSPVKEQAEQTPTEFMRLMASGKRHEMDKNISFAHADYQEALRLDPESREAREAVDRVKARIRDEEFQHLMSEGLTAMHNSNYQLAREKMLKAKSFRPKSQEVEDALAQMDQAILLARIETYRKKAADAELAENWELALNTYLQVLKIDTNVLFAAQGKQRALKLIRIEKRINFFLKQPAALESEQQLKNAIQVIAEIEEIEPRGPRLEDKLGKLTLLVETAQTPEKIILESDNFTEVAVYKVGKLGRFVSRELNLRPGTYTVVGTRDGYQDVRMKIIIKPGQGSTRITVKCKVKI